MLNNMILKYWAKIFWKIKRFTSNFNIIIYKIIYVSILAIETNYLI